MIEPVSIRDHDTGKRAILLYQAGSEWTKIDVDNTDDLALYFWGSAAEDAELPQVGRNVQEIANQAPLGILQVYRGKCFYVIACT